MPIKKEAVSAVAATGLVWSDMRIVPPTMSSNARLLGPFDGFGRAGWWNCGCFTDRSQRVRALCSIFTSMLLRARAREACALYAERLKAKENPRDNWMGPSPFARMERAA